MQLKQPPDSSSPTQPDFDVAEKDKTPELYAQMIRFYASFYNRIWIGFNGGEREVDNTYLQTPVQQMDRWFSYYLGRQPNRNFNHLFAGGIAAPWINGQKIPQLINKMDGNINKLLSDMKVSTKALSKNAKSKRTQMIDDIMLKFDNPEFFKDLEAFGAKFKAPEPKRPIYSQEDAEKYVEYDYKENSELYAQEIGNNIFTKNGCKQSYRKAFKHCVIGGLTASHKYAVNGFVRQETLDCRTVIWDNRIESDHNKEAKFRGFVRFMPVTEVIQRYKGNGGSTGLTEDDINDIKKLSRETPENFESIWNVGQNFPWFTLQGMNRGLAGVSVVTMYWIAMRDSRYKESTDKFGDKVVAKINDNAENEIKRKHNQNKSGDYWVMDVYKGTIIANKYLVDWGLCENIVRDPYNQSDPLMPIEIYIPNMTLDQYRSYVSRLHELQDLADAAVYKVCEKWGKDKGLTYLLLGSKLGHIDPQTLMTDLASMGTHAVPGTDGEGDTTGANTRSVEQLDFRLDPNIMTYWNLKLQFERTMEEICSIPSVALGQQDPTGGLGVQQNILAESNEAISPLYEGFLKFIENDLQYAVNMQKNIYCIEGNEDAEMVIGERGMEYIKATKDFLFENIGVFISTKDIINDRLRQQLADMAFNLSQNGGQISPLDMLKIYTETNVLELENSLEEALKREERKRQQSEAQAAQQAQALQQQKNDAAIQQSDIREQGANDRAASSNKLQAMVEAAKLEQQQNQSMQQPA